MASLQELRKRLRSIRATGQMAGAMRTAATAKYARLGRVRADFGPYAAACRELLGLLGGAGLPHAEGPDPDRACLVILGGNRGMCGGFNAELARFLEEELPRYADPRILVCGRRPASFLRDRGYGFEDFPVSDVPAFQELRPVSDRVRALYASGEVGRAVVLYQRFENMLTQTPGALRILPEGDAHEDGEALPPLLLPDRETVAAQIAVSCFEAQLFDLALESAAGAQAATLMAMRSACDNAAEAAERLELTINRRRQAEVTASVIETSSQMP